jgi:hypothetical protein
MNLKELYQATLRSEHARIKVIGDKVIVCGQDGVQELYLIDNEGELWPVMAQSGHVFQCKAPLSKGS